MSCFFRHVLVSTVMLALVASAAAWRQCTGLQLAAASIGHGLHIAGHDGQTLDHSGHDHQGMHHQHLADDAPASPPADDHGCMKCCSMCTVANASLPTTAAAVIFTVSTHIFPRDDKRWSGNTVAVDPGIPKRIV